MSPHGRAAGGSAPTHASVRGPDIHLDHRPRLAVQDLASLHDGYRRTVHASLRRLLPPPAPPRGARPPPRAPRGPGAALCSPPRGPPPPPPRAAPPKRGRGGDAWEK